MASLFRPELPNGPFGDPLVVVHLRWMPRVILFDCGDLSQVPARTLLETSDVLISHAHVDHVFGLGRLLRTRMNHDERSLRLYGPPGLAAQVRAHLAGYTWNLVRAIPIDLTIVEVARRGTATWRFPRDAGFDPVLVGESPADSQGLLARDELLSIYGAPLDHGGIPSLAYRLQQHVAHAVDPARLAALGLQPGPWLTRLKIALREGADGDLPIEIDLHKRHTVSELEAELIRERPGDVIAYGTDFAPSPSNVDVMVGLGRGSRLLILEAYFMIRDRELAARHAHLTTADAGLIARSCRAGYLCAFHHSPRYEEAWDALRDEIAASADPIPLLDLPTGFGAPREQVR